MTSRPESLLLISALCLSTALTAQTTAGILDSRRTVDWSRAGVSGGIPTGRDVICTTLNPGASAAQINSAIAGCGNGQVVFLNAGTYAIGSPGIIFNNKSDVTLRGAGPDKTSLIFNGSNSCQGLNGDICVFNGDGIYYGSPGNTANWTGSHSKGATTITLDNVGNLRAGSMLILDQLNDSNTDNGQVWVCGSGGQNACCVDCQSGSGRDNRHNRQQQQVVKVTAVSGNQVTLEDPIMMPNWRSGQNPGAWWSGRAPVSGVGIEDLSLDHSSSGASSGMIFYNSYGSWAKNIRSIRANRNHVWLYQSAHITIRDSYFFATRNAASQSYGIEHFTSSGNLIENNILQRIAAPLLAINGQGSVFGYNYTIDNYFAQSPNWLSHTSFQHGAGSSYLLYEGNNGAGLEADYFHGLTHFVTVFRNQWSGWEPGKSSQTVPIIVYMGHRYYNFVGNVLGQPGYHTSYESVPGGGSANCNKSIFALGWGGNCGSGPLPDDRLVASTSLRWGNYDTVNNAARFQATEVPSSGSYANAVPANQNLPASFYLSARPGWWGGMPFPAIGPDVSGGAGPGGRAHPIPAQACYNTSPKDSSGLLTFNATGCYQPTAAGPSPPTNLRVTVQ